MLVAREREPGVDDDDRAVRLVDGHVLADLAEAAERDDAADAHRAESTARLGGGRREQPGALEAGADLRELVLVGLDHREAMSADLVAREVERRLDRDRVDLDPKEVVRRLEFLVNRARVVDVRVAVPTDHLRDLRAPQMGGYGYDADATQREEG